ncbi:hypothetical protein M3P05_19885 [Sansalvadorimonas sp. 2012CJ34-2]|uniref:Uncharacterized protein n=1 Tax=Parendozoicomonas callyspongiae TaxID=2942213 RepID=A0ABT0PLB9_9GAMM|nr:hypothetical protein [Sansalvadorimonas sp. 2012CJ34-2]MCL6272185.1 hypothetical protein [Sansalvadorimonas sp. 2012CJ34-2]
MKLKKLLNFDFIEDFQSLLETGFEKELFLSSLRNYCSHGNPLRFHNFAFSMRELVLHLIDKKAKNEDVKKASWYKKESEKFEVTRRQKLKYCAQGILSDKYLDRYTLDELNLSIKEYLKEFNFFNKYTHITEKHLHASPKKFFLDMKYIIQRSKEVIEEIDDFEKIIKNCLEGKIYEPVMNAAIFSSPEDLSIISQRFYIDDITPEGLEIEYFDDEGIDALVEGTIHVTQEYGPRHDLCQISASYPFKLPVKACIRDPDNITASSGELDVDTSSWYE